MKNQIRKNSKNFLKAFFAICFLCFCHISFASIETKWQKIKTMSGVDLYTGKVEGQDLVAFKGEAVIEAPLEKVATLLYEMELKPKWMYKVVESKVLRYTSELSRIEYNQTSAPWPLQNRDFVFEVKVSFSPDKKKIFLDLSNTEDPLAPTRENVVRGAILRGHYELEQLENNKTKFLVEIHSDPKGSIPTWLVNVFQRNWPYKTISNLENYLKNNEIKSDSTVVKMLKNSSF